MRSWLPAAHTAAAIAAAVLLVAACGGSPGDQVAQLGSTATTTTPGSAGPGATDKYAAALAYSRCMRSHGMPGFPDPKHVGGSIQISGFRSGLSPQSPALQSAQRSCRHLLPGGGQPAGSDQQRVLARMLHVSQCMRARGISSFPDPTRSPPSRRAGYSAITSNEGVWLAIPDSIDVRSQPFEQAAAACNLEAS